MKINWKRVLMSAMAMSLLTVQTAFANVSMNLFYNGQSHAYNAKEVTILIDGEELVPQDMPAVIVDGRTLLPMRLIAQELGCDVIWTEATKQAFVMNDDYTLAFTIDSKEGVKNGEFFEMDVPAMVINDRTMLPVRALSKALDLNITWDDATRTVSIYNKTEQPSETPTETPTEKPSNPSVATGDTISMVSATMPSAKSGTQTFIIQANAPITDFEELYVDDSKIVLDIYNANNQLSEKYTNTNSTIVTAVRTAEHTEEGTPYTRVVLDVATRRGYTVTQSADKTQIIVKFEKTVVDRLTAKDVSGKDRITISGDGVLGANVFTLSNPQRIVVDIPNVESSLKDEIDADGLNFVQGIRTGMFDETTLRVVLEVGQLTDYLWEEKNDGLEITVQKSTLQNLFFEGSENALYLSKESDFDIDDIRIYDNYLDGYTTIELPEDCERDYGYGTLHIGNGMIDTIQLQTASRATTIKFAQSQICAYEIDESDEYYIIYVKNPKDVYDRVLLLDAGHGEKDPGTNGNGLVEKNLNLTISQKIVDELSDSGIKVYVTRDDDSYPENVQRARTANQIADLMVSIHMNAAEGNTSANGTETLYAIREESGGGSLTSLKAAEIMQKHILEALDTTNRGVKQRNDLLILNSTNMPAILVEVCFLSNPGDALKISNANTQDELAESVAEAIIEMFDQYSVR